MAIREVREMGDDVLEKQCKTSDEDDTSYKDFN